MSALPGEPQSVELEAGRPLVPTDWAFALVATEIAFASDLLGSGVDWMTTTGVRDHDAIATLRPLQRKLRRQVPGLSLRTTEATG